MEEFGYRNLIVWQKAKKLVRLVYAEVKKLPAEERYAMGDQIRRAVVSIPLNIAEGNGRARLPKISGTHPLRRKSSSWRKMSRECSVP